MNKNEPGDEEVKIMKEVCGLLMFIGAIILIGIIIVLIFMTDNGKY